MFPRLTVVEQLKRLCGRPPGSGGGTSQSGLSTTIRVTETAIWFGILVLIVVEVGLITPPVGMNLFVINAMDRSTRIIDTYKSVLPFVASDIVRTGILVAFPGITLFLLRWIY